MRQLEEILWSECISLLTENGIDNRQARSFLGKLRKFNRDTDILFAFADAQKENVIDLIPWLSMVLSTSVDDENLLKTVEPEVPENQEYMEFRKQMDGLTLVNSCLSASKVTFEDDTVIIEPLTNFARTVIKDRLQEITDASTFRVRIA